jgi:hypothetical protein
MEKSLREYEESFERSDSRTHHLIDKVKESSQQTIIQLENQIETERERLRYLVGKTRFVIFVL